MDFKVAGDTHGITAFQLDIKVEGISTKIMKAALLQAKQGRIHILSKMLEVCPKPSEHLSSYAPRIETMKVKPSKIAALIGPGGKQIRSIIDQTGVEIDIDDSEIISASSGSGFFVSKEGHIITNFHVIEDCDSVKVSFKGK